MNTEIKRNLIFYTGYMVFAITGIIYGNHLADKYSFLRIWETTNILLLIIGVPFLFFQARAGLPDFFQTSVSGRNRILIPLITGILFGLADLILFKIILHPQPYTSLPPFTQPFPYSVFLYFSGAFEVEVFYRLIPLTIILMAGKYFKRGRYYKTLFWIAVLLTSFREPLEQLPLDSGILILIYSFTTGFLMNLIQALVYRKAGFIASLSVRLGHYLIWHILLGIYIQYFELSSSLSYL